MKKHLVILVLLCSFSLMKAQTPFYVAFVEDTIVLSVSNPVGSIQWQVTADTNTTWTDIPGAIYNNFNYRITAIGTGFKFFRAAMANPSVCPFTNYYSSTIKCRIVSIVSQIHLGDFYAGGYVFYINGNSGLVSARQDQSISAQWGCEGDIIAGADAITVGTGAQNTIDILNGCSTTGIAAEICGNLTQGNYSDWFLPSKDELYLMYAELKSNGIGNFSGDYYWSSSEYSATQACRMGFNSGLSVCTHPKSSTSSVRACRAFSVPNVQARLNNGESPKHIYDTGMPLDSLYGKTYASGLIFYLNTTNGSGIVASPTNLNNHPVGNTTTSYGCGASTSIGAGPGNTTCLESIFTADGTAADTCVKYNYGGYTDWFLPSSEELLAMWTNLRNKNHGSWNNEYYWSSTNQDYNSGKVVSFITTYLYGQVLSQSRTAGLSVRAARNFNDVAFVAFAQQEPSLTSAVELVPTPPSITNLLQDVTACLGSNSLMRVVVVGDSPLAFKWQKNGIDIAGSDNDTLFFTSLNYTDTADYRCIVTNGCSADTSNIARLNIPVVFAGNDQSICSNNAVVNLAGVVLHANDHIWYGGNGNYAPNANALNLMYTPTASEIASGSLTLTLSSAAGGLCPTMTDDVVITFTQAPIVFAGGDQNLCESSFPIVLSGNVQNAGGGSWSGGNGTFNPLSTTLNASYTPTAAELDAGTVTLTLSSTNNGNCLAVTDQVTFNFSKTPIAHAGNDIVVCNTAGFVSVPGSVINATGGIWSGGSGGYNPSNTSLTINYFPTLQEITNGEVTLTLATSGNGYCQPATDNVHIEFGQEPILSVLNLDDVTCFGFCNGTATVNVSGGTQPYSYLWPSTAGSLTVPSSSALCAGNYLVTVSDAAGCVVSTSIEILQPDMLTASVSSVVNNQCYGGSEGVINTTVSGGTGPYTYHWSNGSTLANAYGLAAGTYAVTIIDARGCYKMLSSISVTQRPKMNINVVTTNAMCNQSDGTATASVTGGTGAYTFLWSNNATANPVTDLSAGSYFVLVSDANECVESKYFSVSNNGGFVLSATTQNVSCSGNDNGSINMTITGGSAPFEIEWSNGETTEDISGLIIGPYDVIVTDVMGCMGMESYNILDGALLSSSSSIVQPTCNQSDGEISITINGGATPYAYSWSNGATTSSLTGLTAGNFYFTATDNDGCVAEGFIGLTNAGAPVISIDDVTSAPCGGDGNAMISVTSGTAPFNFHWSDASTNEDLENVSPGMYSVTVTDQVGCATIENIEIPVIDLPIQPICIVTVDTTYGRNLVVWERTSASGVDHYKVYRETSVPNQYQLIANVNADNMTEFLDMAANPFVRSFRYKISAVDMCGNETALSSLHKTMHLTMNQGIGTSYNLIWDDYEGFNYTSVIVMRYLPSTGWVNLDTLPKTLHSYTDVAPSTTGIRYLVRIDAPSACSPTSVTKEVGGPYSSSYSNMEDEGILVSAEQVSQKDGSFILYPNPASGYITLKALSELKDFSGIKIFDYTGKLVLMQNDAFNGETKIDISNLTKGMYLIEVGNNQVFRGRFIVE